jgi:hypothetical protein
VADGPIALISDSGDLSSLLSSDLGPKTAEHKDTDEEAPRPFPKQVVEETLELQVGHEDVVAAEHETEFEKVEEALELQVRDEDVAEDAC